MSMTSEELQRDIDRLDNEVKQITEQGRKKREQEMLQWIRHQNETVENGLDLSR